MSNNASTHTARRLYLPSRVRSLGRKLLTQQCWCWGLDVRHAQGNALCRRGFERFPAPDGERGATTYLRVQNGVALALWGFGIWYGEAASGAIFLGRFDFEPRLCDEFLPPCPAWLPQQVRDATRAPLSREERRLAREMMSRALLQIAEDEERVQREMGILYRRECLKAWPVKPLDGTLSTPAKMPRMWRELSALCRTSRAVKGVVT
jgi:hypothetical protein